MVTKKIQRVRELFSLTRSAASCYGTGFSSMLTRVFNLFFIRKFSQSEIFAQALVDPKLDADALSRYVEKEESWPVYTRMNQGPEQRRIDDKALFQDKCAQSGLAIPPLLGLLTPIISSLDCEDDQIWHNRLLHEFPDRFVAKPTLSLKGAGVLLIHRKNEEFSTSTNELLDVDQLMQALRQTVTLPMIHPCYRPEDQRVIFQEQLVSHPQLAEISGKDGIQCVRVCTALDDRDRPSIVFAFLKIIAGGNNLDTFDRGKTGNLLGLIEPDSGRLYRVIGCPGGSDIAVPLHQHPDTGHDLIDFPIPEWQAVVELALAAAKAFSPVGFVGWDVAITDREPVLIEGNTTWDPVAPFNVPLQRIDHWSRARSSQPNH